MIQILALVVGAGVGFAGSRLLRRPDRAAQISSAARDVSSSLNRQRRLDLPELQRACYSEMVRHVVIDRTGRGTVPGRYRLHLNPGDMARIDEARRWFTEGLIEALLSGSAAHGWDLVGSVQITYESDPGRQPGAPRAVVTSTPSVAAPSNGAAPAAPAAPGKDHGPGPSGGLSVVRTDTGQRFILERRPVTIGRSSDRTITIADDRVSRHHARIEFRSGGWWLADVGSANGTRRGGERIQPGSSHRLRPGDVFSVGPVHLRVVPTSDHTPAGSTPVRAEDHLRITGEVVPRFQEITGDPAPERLR